MYLSNMTRSICDHVYVRVQHHLVSVCVHCLQCVSVCAAVNRADLCSCVSRVGVRESVLQR